ncbi:hypothetical protein LXL04_008137 [Taraxacum kok-saghyz]
MDEFQSLLVGKKSKTDASGSVLATHCFSYEESRKDLVRMIAQHDYPLCMVEHVGFIVFSQGMQPLFKSITRNTAKADLVSVYEEEKTKLMQFLGSIKGRIAITTDMWTSNHQRKGYMTLTAHFTDDSWKLQSRLLSVTELFQYWQESHGVMAMATILDPRFKMKILEFYFPLIYGVDEAKAHVLIAKKTYPRAKKSNDDSAPISTQNATPEVEIDSVACGKTELEMYLEEYTLPGSHDFDILAWWKQNGIKHPTLIAIARDILAIPISTVASESSFSTSGCVADGGDDLNVDED